MSIRPRPIVLCILDGWGFRAPAPDNATTCAKTPVFKKYLAQCPHALLQASEENVGLPRGQIGNSEVGHMNLGAGRVVFQDLPMIDRALAAGGLKTNPALKIMIAALKKSGGTCHLMGLASPGGVHAHQDHIVALAKELANAGVAVNIHAFLDGRDEPPKSAAGNIKKLLSDIEGLKGVRLATLCGRYYAMDRDKRWERVILAYDLLASGEGAHAADALKAIASSYAASVTDEFLKPVVLGDYKGMKDGDAAFCEPDFKDFPRKKTVELAAVAGMVEYSDALNKHMTALFPPKRIDEGLGEIVAKAGLRQLRIAETEKYPHVTFFFNGGREQTFENEERILVPSPKVATYDLQPEMSAYAVTDKVVAAIEEDKFDLIVLNYANPDMVGHTGVLSAAIKAVEAVDECLGRVFAAIKKKGGAVLLTADHGNCEIMADKETKGPHTAHTLNPVPVVLIGGPQEIQTLRDGKLADIAPTILDLMRLPVPDVMDGRSLIVRP